MDHINFKTLHICMKAVSRRIRNYYNLPWLTHMLPVLWPRSSTKEDYASSHESKELHRFVLVEDLDIRDCHHMYLRTTLFTLMNTVLNV